MRRKILVVDDEPDIVESLKTLLEAEDYDVSTAGDGKECLKLIEEGLKPDLIIMDFFMPEISGRETVERIRQTPGHKDTKVLFLSVAEFKTKGLEKLKELDIIDHIQKPIDIKEFTTRIRGILEDA